MESEEPMNGTLTAENELSYEQALDRLKSVVDQLERGSLGLEKSLELFEQGISLTRVCDHKLQSVEERIRFLVEQTRQADESLSEPARLG
jgi:exodeoxyribonuclease VII small subunit